jgi:peptide/nickel transport system substrate-binding protein
MNYRSKTKVAGVALAVASITALAACSSGGSSSSGSNNSSSSVVKVPGGIGSIPMAASGGTKKAGTITWAMAPGATPNWIFPVIPSANNSVYTAFNFIWQSWRPVYFQVNGVVPEIEQNMSIANLPVYSNGNKTLTITMKSNYKWSNGKPLTADDLLFAIDLIKAGIKVSPANWAGYTPKHFPDNLVSTSEPNSTTLVLNLNAPVNPTWFTEDVLTSINPMPSADWAKTSASGSVVPKSSWDKDPATATSIFKFLTAQSKSVSTYTTNPLWQIVDGPYKLSQYNTTTEAFTMVPNKTYGGPHVTPMSNFQAVAFTSDAAEFNAVKSKSIDLGYIPSANVPQLPEVLRLGYNYFGMPDFGMNFLNYNFEDKTNHFNSIVNQLYFRQAMAHVEDQQGWISAFMHGAGAPAYGPIPAYPKSPFLPANAATNPYPFSISTATNLLSHHGWKVNAGGTDVCQSAGSGPNQCGAGVPAGTQLKFNLIYNSGNTLITSEMTDLVSKAKQVGINITLQSSNFNYMISNYLDPAAPANANKWAMQDFGGETNATYPTTFGLFNTGGSYQVGNYSDPKADEPINASITGSDPAAVKAEASYLTTAQPTMFEPNQDYIWAWKTNVAATQPEAFENLTQYYTTPEYWYLSS